MVCFLDIVILSTRELMMPVCFVMIFVRLSFLILHLLLFSLLSSRYILFFNLPKTQFLIQECVSLISKPNFISTLCYAIDNPLHYQKVRNGFQNCAIITVVC